jgi:type VI protein secretion system component VasF
MGYIRRMTEQPYTEPGLTERTRNEIMAEIDRQIAHGKNEALGAHHKAFMALIDEIIDGKPRGQRETWLIRQLKNMRTDMVLSGQDHEADVLTQAIIELGGTL